MINVADVVSAGRAAESVIHAAIFPLIVESIPPLFILTNDAVKAHSLRFRQTFFCQWNEVRSIHCRDDSNESFEVSGTSRHFERRCRGSARRVELIEGLRTPKPIPRHAKVGRRRARNRFFPPPRSVPPSPASSPRPSAHTQNRLERFFPREISGGSRNSGRPCRW